MSIITSTKEVLFFELIWSVYLAKINTGPVFMSHGGRVASAKNNPFNFEAPPNQGTDAQMMFRFCYNCEILAV